ncbi:MAG: hypothetical protein F9K16_04190 [Thermoanaerobaculia bacterium]|nr:MAG: hypothetical protein F9K16_04190 [Thermoanaerobaculia bacterium]MBZ0103301.1 hypothetical protein [Thermoanaerobaculia bacterium]
MSSSAPRSEPERGRGAAATFPVTQWSVVAAAARSGDSAARAALATLLTRYRAPLVLYARHRGYGDAAEDRVQDFFVHLLERDTLARARRERGRFRSFLLACFRYHLADQLDRARAVRRGGGAEHTALDADAAATLRSSGDAGSDAETPESLYARRWALATLEHALAAVEREYVRNGRQAVFAALRGALDGELEESYAELAARLGSTAGALKVAVHRLRRRFAAALRAAVAATVVRPEQVDDELRFLVRSLGGR